MAIRVLVVDDHGVTREGLAQLLAAEHDMEVVGLASDGATALKLTDELRPDVVLLDLRLPDLDGLRVAAAIRRSLPETKVVTLTGNEHSEQYARELLRLGISAYLSKTLSGRDLANALRVAQAGGSIFPPALLSQIVGTTELDTEIPTTRELEVLTLVARGLANRDIARELAMSERTVQFHLSNLFAKLHVKSRTSLIHTARDRGWLH